MEVKQLTKISKLTPLRKSIELYKLRETLDEDSFRHIATLLSIDLCRGENSKRWAIVEEEIVEETLEEITEYLDNAEALDVIEDNEYIGRRVVEKIWKSSI